MKILSTTISQQIKYIRENFPKTYAAVFNRMYKNTEQFHDYRYPLYVSASTAIQGNRIMAEIKSKRTLQSDVLANAMLFDCAWYEYGRPMFFLDNKLLEACQMTSPPHDIEIENFPMPYEAMAFILPKGNDLLYAGKHELCYIGIARVTQKTFKPEKYDVMPFDTQFIISTIMPETGESFSVRARPDALRDLFEKGVEHVALEHAEAYPELVKTQDEYIEDGRFYLRLLHIALNVILAMDAVPTILEKERRLHQHKKDRNTTIYTPNIVGAKYRIIHKNESGEKGTHSSPRLHWRRGHFRRQGMGARVCECNHSRVSHFNTDGQCLASGCDCQKLSDVLKFERYETKWIQPILVNKHLGA